MKKILLALFLFTASCAKEVPPVDDVNGVPGSGSGSGTSSGGGSGSGSGGSSSCGYHNGHRLYRGPEGGCYYINSNGNKTYVDRSKCNC